MTAIGTGKSKTELEKQVNIAKNGMLNPKPKSSIYRGRSWKQSS